MCVSILLQMKRGILALMVKLSLLWIDALLSSKLNLYLMWWMQAFSLISSFEEPQGFISEVSPFCVPRINTTLLLAVYIKNKQTKNKISWTFQFSVESFGFWVSAPKWHCSGFLSHPVLHKPGTMPWELFFFSLDASIYKCDDMGMSYKPIQVQMLFWLKE